MSWDRFGDYSNIRRRPAGQVDLAIVPPAAPKLLVIDEPGDVSPEMLALCDLAADVFNDGPVS